MEVLTLVDPVPALRIYDLQIRAADWIGYRHENAVVSRNGSRFLWTRAVFLHMELGPEGDEYGTELQTKFALFGKKTIPSLYWAASKYLRGKSLAAWTSHKGKALLTSKGSYGDVPAEIRGCKVEARRELQVSKPKYRKLLRTALHAHRDSLVPPMVDFANGTLLHGPLYRKHPKPNTTPHHRRQRFNLNALPRELIVRIIDFAVQATCPLSITWHAKQPTSVIDVHPTKLHLVNMFFRELALESFWKLVRAYGDELLPRCTVLKLFKMVFGYEKKSDKWVAKVFGVDKKKVPGWVDAWDTFDAQGKARCLCIRPSMGLVGFPLSEDEL